MRSLQNDIIYSMNIENTECKESKSLEKLVFHSSANGCGNLTVTIAGHSLVSGEQK